MSDPRSGRTTWHITFGTYGARLHGGSRPTVYRRHNEIGMPFVGAEEKRWAAARGRMIGSPVRLSEAQCDFVESVVPEICRRGGWDLRVCAAAPDHVHVLIDVEVAVHGKQVRALIKRWLSQALDRRWNKGRAPAWWAEGGSTKVVKNRTYRANALTYIEKQRSTGSGD